MRIVSQDRKLDIPYECMIVNVGYQKNDKIIARAASSQSDNYIILGDYEEKRAKEILDEIRAAYVNGYRVYEMP